MWHAKSHQLCLASCSQQLSPGPGRTFLCTAPPSCLPPTLTGGLTVFQPPARLVYASDSPLCFPAPPCTARNGVFPHQAHHGARTRTALTHRACENSFGPTRQQTHLSTLRFAKLALLSPPPPVAAWGSGLLVCGLSFF